MKKRILLKLLKMYKEDTNVNVKAKIKYAMTALNEENKNEMKDFIFDVHTTDIESFDSSDAATNILDFSYQK